MHALPPAQRASTPWVHPEDVTAGSHASVPGSTTPSPQSGPSPPLPLAPPELLLPVPPAPPAPLVPPLPPAPPLPAAPPPPELEPPPPGPFPTSPEPPTPSPPEPVEVGSPVAPLLAADVEPGPTVALLAALAPPSPDRVPF